MSRRLHNPDLKVIAIDDGDKLVKIKLSDHARARGSLKLDAVDVAALVSILGVIVLKHAERNNGLNEPLTEEMIETVLRIAGEQIKAEALISEALRK